MRVLVCGGRDETRKDIVHTWLHEMDKEVEITGMITGGATGVDTFAAEWAKLNNIPCTVVKADWEKYGKRAGPIRNTIMLNMFPDVVVAINGGRGTAHTVSEAKKRNIGVVEIRVK